MDSETTAKVAGALVLAAAGIAAWGVFVERTRFTLRKVTIEALEPGSTPIRALHISDLHVTNRQLSKQRWVRELATLEPDLIINTGDNWGSDQALDGLRNCLDGFAGIPGVFVFGSNDYFGPTFKNPLRYLGGPSEASAKPEELDHAALRAYLEEDLGWVDLNNSAATLAVGSSLVEFFGVDDPHHAFDDVDKMIDALDGVRAVSGPVVARVGVTHAPYARTLNSLVDAGADVLFAGHTHGGQVCIPGFGALVTNCDLPRKQAKGSSTWSRRKDRTPLHVSAGLGTSIYAPVRFACPPEATLVTLIARKN